MAGHSKWANIKHRKARVDEKRGKAFTKLGKEILVAARHGGGDPEANLDLKTAIARAREVNMPMDNINRLIAKATGELEGVDYEEVNYEGYASGGVAVLIETLTDNRNRTAPEIRHLFSRYEGNLGEAGCVAWMFEMKGTLSISKEGLTIDPEDLMLLLIEDGAEDVRDEEETIEVVTAPDDLEKVKELLDGKKLNYSDADTTMVPDSTVPVTDKETAAKILDLLNQLEDHDDVQHVYANFDIPDEIIQQLE
ncbi:MAG: YebC/PmpR family DNA-binding transcriptional regulator [Syntrophaceticus sp.]|jgi:YebC/PmpR family DNA-binding regulatory protein|nr:YebC/PmpR family DNA-binding transcriptional regulator [Syntrophaceticus sp.]MDD3314714.1 YebC/PmpR family DNA-binding transcriptional regulator [Syntrophaceticus sp.]MDD4360432.1 YebC/PmpR family DNA-binding transcriptional regulator [Syntrophaceticus sp.]MDD4783736.1 YebC/PmpR family DNA-binding transcriptional regulator [Syntrophaceticus sp.]